MMAPPKEQTATHVVFLLHGFWGAPSHMFALRDSLLAEALRHKASISIHCCGSYQGTLTYDGVDVCADRATDEITRYVQALQGTGVRPGKFSILGYSLGGLIARMVVQKLQAANFFDHVQPCNFATFASPAIGIPLLSGAIPSIIHTLGSFFLSRSGKHLFLRDKRRESGRPLVYDLATKEFTSAVAMFSNVGIYANCVGDRVVPYMTGGITARDPFLPALTRGLREGIYTTGNTVLIDKLELSFDPDFPAVISNVRLVSEQENTTHSRATGEAVSESMAITTPSKPSALSVIRPWFNPSTYPFLRAPLNYLLVLLIPLVVPAILLVITAFAVQRVSSSIRVHRHLHRQRGHPSVVKPSPAADAAALKDLEAQVNDTDTLAQSPTTGLSPASTFAIQTSITADLSGVYSSDYSRSLPPTQLEMIKMLDESLHMRKHLAFIPNVFTSHPVILCQDAGNPEHQQGLGVVRHWAHNFAF